MAADDEKRWGRQQTGSRRLGDRTAGGPKQSAPQRRMEWSDAVRSPSRPLLRPRHIKDGIAMSINANTFKRTTIWGKSEKLNRANSRHAIILGCGDGEMGAFERIKPDTIGTESRVTTKCAIEIGSIE